MNGAVKIPRVSGRSKASVVIRKYSAAGSQMELNRTGFYESGKRARSESGVYLTVIMSFFISQLSSRFNPALLRNPLRGARHRGAPDRQSR